MSEIGTKPATSVRQPDDSDSCACKVEDLALALKLLLSRDVNAIQNKETAMKKMFKVLCPITKKDGSTYWMRVGTGFPNKDDSVNLYLDVLPANQKLQLREMDEEDLRVKDGGGRRPSRPQSLGDSADSLPF
jgi:hypothetical protein